MLLTSVFIKDYLIKGSVAEARSNQITQSSIVASQIAPYMINIDNQYTKTYVEDIVKQHSFDSNSRVLLINSSKRVILDAFEDVTNHVYEIPEIEDALMGTSSANIYVFNDGYVLYSGVPIVLQNEIVGAIFMSVDATSIFENVNEVLDKLKAISILALFIAFFISILFAEVVSAPIEKLTESVIGITQGNYETKVEVNGSDEIAELGMAFNTMAIRLHQVDDRRKKFVSNVSHELRTPMTSMKIVSDTLLGQGHWEEEIYREFLTDINGEIDRLNNIIDSLLYLVRVEKDDIELDYSMTYVNYLIEKVIKTLKPIADKKNIDISFLAHQKIQINLDQEKMQQCLLNIIGNSVKYTPEGGNVIVSLEENRDKIIIAIDDTGIGIPEKDIPFIFDRFYRVDEARARKTGGTGLGLSIAQQIVHIHQGSIEVTSIVNEGTKVIITLPKK